MFLFLEEYFVYVISVMEFQFFLLAGLKVKIRRRDEKDLIRSTYSKGTMFITCVTESPN